MGQTLDEVLAARLARVALRHFEDDKLDRRDHAASFGAFDWHGRVHGYWTLARLLRRFPAMAPAGEVRALFDRRLTPDAVAGVLADLGRPSARSLERPYGWAWLLKLAAELRGFDDPVGARWSVTLEPLAEAFADRFTALLPLAAHPDRTGSHGNSAFALALAAEGAKASCDDALLGLLWEKAVDWYGRDRDRGGQACEPAGDGFLSPALMEAECMRRLLPAAQWRPWFDAFLPGLAAGEPATLFRPARVGDRPDGEIAGRDGLNLSRAWCFRSLAGALPNADPRRARMEDAAEAHLAAALPMVAGDDRGDRQLAGFALLALDA